MVKSFYDEITIAEDNKSSRQIFGVLEENLNEKALWVIPKDLKLKQQWNFVEKLLERVVDDKKDPGKKSLMTIVCIGSVVNILFVWFDGIKQIR